MTIRELKISWEMLRTIFTEISMYMLFHETIQSLVPSLHGDFHSNVDSNFSKLNITKKEENFQSNFNQFSKQRLHVNSQTKQKVNNLNQPMLIIPGMARLLCLTLSGNWLKQRLSLKENQLQFLVNIKRQKAQILHQRKISKLFWYNLSGTLNLG